MAIARRPSSRLVSRTRYEQPFSAGVPTPLPKISTLCVLPNPPGSNSVFSASRWLKRQSLEHR